VAGGVGAPGEAQPGPGALAEARAALRGAIGLLQGDAGVPHLRLLPYRAPLLVLARFAALHPQPLPRSRTLLTRWFWRGVVAGTHSDSSQATVLGQLRALDGDEEESVQRLIGLAPSSPDLDRLTALSAGWNARFAHTRVVAAVLAARVPGDDGAEAPGWSRARLQAALHEAEVSALFQPLLPGAAGSLAGRALLPPGLSPAALPAALDPELADALLINPAAAAALEAGDAAALVAARAPLVAAEVERRLRQWAAPGEHDRPTVRHLLRAR
jgi:hypothetical protein